MKQNKSIVKRVDEQGINGKIGVTTQHGTLEFAPMVMFITSKSILNGD